VEPWAGCADHGHGSLPVPVFGAGSVVERERGVGCFSISFAGLCAGQLLGGFKHWAGAVIG